MTPEDIVVGKTGARFLGRHFPCTIGRGGFSNNKCEGDGATPIGTHRIVGMLYRADRIARPASWALPIGLCDGWSDDVGDDDYNLMIRRPHPYSHETLRRADPLYDLAILTDWNWPNAVPGKGSAIFVHRWRRPGYPTEGCVAFSPDHLLWIAQHIGYGTRMVVTG